MFIYPLLYKAGLLGSLTETQYGIFAGGSIHEVAQAIAAGSGVSQHAEEIATTVKMIRVMLLAPMLIVLGIWISRAAIVSTTGSKEQKQSMMKIIPWFAVGFIAVAGFNSLGVLPETIVTPIKHADQFLLAMAMTALGLETHVSKFIKAGIKPLLLALVLFAWLFFGGLSITYLVTSIV